MKKSHWSTALRRLGACTDALEWAEGYKTPEAAWRYCHRGDWMLWIAGKTCGDDRRQLVLTACACARLALKHVPKGEERPRKAIETAEAWARGDSGVTLDDVSKAADAAYAAYYAAYAASAAAGASDAAYAAYAASAAAGASGTAAYYAAYAAARAKTLRQCAVIVRKMLPMPKVPQ